MIEQITPFDYLTHHREKLLIDVRSPAEYSHSHIPGAVSLPLFSDEERAIVGTLYKKEGREVAVQKGLTFVSPRLNQFIDEVRLLASKNQQPHPRDLVIYCARGGMRSRSLAMLFECAHFHVFQIIGGYKAYKTFLRTTAEQRTNLLLIGGKTGSGKTAILQELAHLNEQVIDLEGEACHRGSTYGALGQKNQPSQEQYIVRLLTQLALFDPQKPVWVEHEGNRLGDLFVPQELWNAMIKAPVILINVPTDYRKKRLITEYGSFSGEELITCTTLLASRLGSEATKNICSLIAAGDIDHVTDMLMEHYDRAYTHATERDTQRGIRTFIAIDLKGDSPLQHAEELIRLRCSLT